MRKKHPYHYPNKPKYYIAKLIAWINIRIPRKYYTLKIGKQVISGFNKTEAYDEKLAILLHDPRILPNDIVIYSFWSTELKISKLEEFQGW